MTSPVGALLEGIILDSRDQGPVRITLERNAPMPKASYRIEAVQRDPQSTYPEIGGVGYEIITRDPDQGGGGDPD